MKKLLLMLGLVLAATLGAYALTVDEILGKWESNTIKTDPTPEMPLAVSEKYIVTYKADNVADFRSDGSLSIELGGGAVVDIFMKIEAQAEYTVAGDSITITPVAETIKLSFGEDDLRVRGIEDAEQAEAIRTEMYNGMSQNIEDMKEGFNEPTVFNEVLVVGNKMTCKIDDQYVSFKRKKK